jgi:hypothetical protein
MNSKQRVDAVIRGEMPDQVPVCLHNFLPTRLFRYSGPENSVLVPIRKAADPFGSTALLYYSVERCLICFIRALDQATFDAVGGVAFRTGRFRSFAVINPSDR